MQDESNFKLGCSQVIDDLPPRERRQDVGRLHFNDDIFINDDVGAMIREKVAFVSDWDGDFSADCPASSDELSLKSQRIDVLEKAVAKRVVNLEKRANDCVRRFSFQKSDLSHAALFRRHVTSPSNRSWIRGHSTVFARIRVLNVVESSGTHRQQEFRNRRTEKLDAWQARDVAATGGNAESYSQTKRERRAYSDDWKKPGHQRADQECTGTRHEWRERVVHGVHIAEAFAHEGAGARITENCNGHGNGEAEKQREHSEFLLD
jgi:hypothetical protein